MLPAILKLARAEGQRPSSMLNVQEPDFYRRFFTTDGEVFTAHDGETLVGFTLLGYAPLLGSLWPPYLESLGVDPSRAGVFTHLLVRPEDRGRGIGPRLLV